MSMEELGDDGVTGNFEKIGRWCKKQPGGADHRYIFRFAFNFIQWQMWEDPLTTSVPYISLESYKI